MKTRKMYDFVALCLLMFATVAHGESDSYLLRLVTPEVGNFSTKLEVHAKSRMQMLFMPAMDTFFKLDVEQATRMINENNQDKIISETQISDASLEYYMPGQPNQGMHESVIEPLLWVSGLGSRKTPITVSRNNLGIVTDLEGVPDEYAKYYQHDLVFYPENPLKIGDTWQRKFMQPLAVDFHQPPYDVEITGEYTLKRLHKDGSEAEIEFVFKADSDYAMQQGKKVKVDVELLREGSMLIGIKDGWPRSVKSMSKFSIQFSEQNYIKSEEDYRSITREIKREQLEKTE